MPLKGYKKYSHRKTLISSGFFVFINEILVFGLRIQKDIFLKLDMNSIKK